MSTPDDITPALKRCPKCGETKPLTAFSRNSRTLSGLQCYCKSCNAAYVTAHRDRILVKQREYWAANRDKMAAYRAANRERRSKQEAAYRAAHKEKYTALYASYQADNPERHAANERNRRARISGNGGTHTVEDIQAQYDRQKGKCFYCKSKVGEDYHVDHVIPIAKGGSNGPENLVVACPTCNVRKSDKHPMDFAGRMV